MDTPIEKDCWDKARSVAAPLATFVGTVILAVTGHMFAKAQKDSENSVKYVEFAISILRAEPTADTLALRSWAVDVLSDGEPKKMSEETKAALKKYRMIVYDRGYVGTTYDGPGGTARSFLYPSSTLETELAPSTDRTLSIERSK